MTRSKAAERFDDGFLIRPAEKADVATILGLVREIAEFEKLTHQLIATEADFREALFGPQPSAEAVIAELDGRPVGYAIFCHNFSTFIGRRGLYLEDLYLQPDFRKRGLGRRILRYLARLAVERRCGRFEWTALDWNQPAIDSYLKIGAEPMKEWIIFRLSEEGIAGLAERELP